ncbi:MAG: alpha/beta fold hydrolase [Photobacterium frigidiphilum]|uniref:alpha/beta fold hydrolase n=1 Tax=Photobacterium frigidiphilum TaxID=264736 RepID=UPI003001348A
MTQLSTVELVTKESSFTTLMTHEIHQMWQQRQQNTFMGLNNIPIRWISITHQKNTQCVVIVNGRNESFWKYQEVFYEFSRRGFDVFALDHRGQGASGRITTDPEVGHVDSFNDYVEDLHQFVDSIVKPSNYKRAFMLAHSMGGAITTLYLEQHPDIFDAAVLNAPMFGIRMPAALHCIAPFMAKMLTKVAAKYQQQPSYLFGQKAYYEASFENNDQCQSLLRYVWAKHLYQLHPELRIGGPSARWLWQALTAADKCIRDAEKLKTPILLLQAGNDTIVDNKAQRRFNCVSEQCQIKVIEQARHELLMEKDELRNQALTETVSFFDRFTVIN